MNAALLFEGIGGFGLACERAGIDKAWSSEIDRHASAVLDHHWPGVKNLGDIHDIKDPPRVDVLTGGFPCQDYSVAGTRGGLAGDRGALWWEFHRLIVESRPTWVVGENVPGLLSSRGGADFETIVGSLTECGYGVAWAVLDAQYFGVAQRRRRVFIVGHSGGEPRPEILALGEGVFGHPEPRREAGEGTAPTLAARTRGGGWPGSDEAIDGALAFNWQSGGDIRLGIKEEHTDALHSSQTPAVAFNPYRTLEKDGSITSGFAERPVVGALHGPTGNKEPLIAHPAVDVASTLLSGENQTGGTRPPGSTVDNADSLIPMSNASVRRLTPLECERLQGFPDGWTDIPGNSDTQRYRQLGNAVAVPVAEWIMQRVAAA